MLAVLTDSFAPAACMRCARVGVAVCCHSDRRIQCVTHANRHRCTHENILAHRQIRNFILHMYIIFWERNLSEQERREYGGARGDAKNKKTSIKKGSNQCGTMWEGQFKPSPHPYFPATSFGERHRARVGHRSDSPAEAFRTACSTITDANRSSHDANVNRVQKEESPRYTPSIRAQMLQKRQHPDQGSWVNVWGLFEVLIA
jgi:hypothetical protein